MVHQVGIHGLIAGDEHHERALPAAARAPGLLPKTSHRARKTSGDHGIEPANVDAQLQGGGGGDA